MFGVFFQYFADFLTDKPDISTKPHESTKNTATVTDTDPKSNDSDSTEETRKLIYMYHRHWETYKNPFHVYTFSA